jgi:hypothetical protein
VNFRVCSWLKFLWVKAMMILEADKIGSATSPLDLTKTVAVINKNDAPKAGDVIVVKAMSESVTYGNLELPNGRLAKINRHDVLIGKTSRIERVCRRRSRIGENGRQTSSFEYGRFNRRLSRSSFFTLGRD